VGARHGKHFVSAGVIEEIVSNFGGWRGVAASHARRPHHPHTRAGFLLQLAEQRLRTEHGAGQGITNPDGERRKVRLAFLDHVEMRVKGRGFKHLGKSQLHCIGQRRQMGCRDLVAFVLNKVEVLDQQVSSPRAATEQKLNLFSRLGINLTALWGGLGLPPALTWMLEWLNFLNAMAHSNVSSLMLSCREG